VRVFFRRQSPEPLTSVLSPCLGERREKPDILAGTSRNCQSAIAFRHTVSLRYPYYFLIPSTYRLSVRLSSLSGAIFGSIDIPNC
jgi:hypothetical protein